MKIKEFEKELNIGKLGFVFYTNSITPHFEITVAKCGYFDGRPEIMLSLILFTLVIKLPWINKKWTDECDPPKYGIAIHDNSFWIYKGGGGNFGGGCKWWTWDIPFFTKNFYKHYILGKNGEWVDVTIRRYGTKEDEFFRKNIGYLDWYPDNKPSDEESLAKIFYGTWIDKYDGKEIDSKYRVEIRQWRPKWFMWTKVFQINRKSIDVCFKEEVGSKKGTWKGGVMGAGMDFKDDQETPEECFKRMNEEKNW